MNFTMGLTVFDNKVTMEVAAKVSAENDNIIGEIILYNQGDEAIFIVSQSLFWEAKGMIKITGPTEIWCDTDSGYHEEEQWEFLKLEPKESTTITFFLSSSYCDFNSAKGGGYRFHFNKYIEICETQDTDKCAMQYLSGESLFHLAGPISSVGVLPDPDE